MKKLTPIFLLLAAFFMVALWVSLSYYEAKQANIPKGTATVVNLLADHADPSSLILTTGSIIQFDIKDNQTHDIYQTDGSGGPALPGGLASGQFLGADGYRLQFSHSGNYFFSDKASPQISLQVSVYDSK